jgi:integration host factor subunit alpha
MTKADLIESLNVHLKLTKREAAEIVESMIESLKVSFEQGQSVKISGFGNFHVREKKPRRGRNPQTGSQIEIPSRRVLAFRAGQQLKSALNPPPGRAKGAQPPTGRSRFLRERVRKALLGSCGFAANGAAEFVFGA